MDEAEGLQEIVIAEEVLLRGDPDSMSVVEALARGVQAGASEFEMVHRPTQTSRRQLRAPAAEFRSRKVGVPTDAPQPFGPPPSPRESKPVPSAARRKRRQSATEMVLQQQDLSVVDKVQTTRRPWWRSYGLQAVSALVSCGLAGAAAYLGIKRPETHLFTLTLWRWLAALSSLAPIYWLTHYALWALMYIAESRFVTTQGFLYWMMGTRSTLKALTWACGTMAVFSGLFVWDARKSARQFDAYVVLVKVLGCVVLVAAANTVSVLVGKLLSTGYHRATHIDKMQAAILREYYLVLMSADNSLKNKPASKPRRARRGSTLVLEEETPSDFKRRRQNSRRDLLTDPDSSLAVQIHKLEKHFRSKKLQMTLTDRLGGSPEKLSDVETEGEARKFAYYLFWNLSSDPERDYIVVEDLRELVPAESVQEAFGVLDRDDSGQATLEEIQESVSEVFRERRNLAETLQDTRNIVGRLDWIFCVILQIVNCFIILAIFDANVKQIWLTFSSAIILFSFVFANSLREFYSNTMFLMATHPYDVGDQVQLDNGDTLTVDRMSIMTTQFIKGDNSRTYIPNAKLSQQSITNLTRSEKKNDSFRVFLDLNTPAETFTELQEMVQGFMDDNPQDYCGECTVQAVAFQDPLKLQLSTNWSYCHAPFEGKKIGKARHAMFLVISGFLASAKADYTLPDLSRSDEKTAQAVASVLRPIRELESR